MHNVWRRDAPMKHTAGRKTKEMHNVWRRDAPMKHTARRKTKEVLNTEYGSKVRIQIEEDWHVMIQIIGHVSEPSKIIVEDCIIMRWRPHMMLQMAHTGLVSLAEYGTKSVVMGVVTFIFQVQQAQPKRNAVQMVFCHL